MKKLYTTERNVVAGAFDWKSHLRIRSAGRIGNAHTCEVTDCSGFLRVRDTVGFARSIKLPLAGVARSTHNYELKLTILPGNNLRVYRWIRIDCDDLVALALQEAEHYLDAKVMDLSSGHLICHELSPEP